MRSFHKANPLVLFFYFATVTVSAMFSVHPWISALSLCGALSMIFLNKEQASFSSVFFFILLFLGMAILNPLLVHNGVTVFFYMNDHPVTWEATLYGLVSSVTILSVLFWFRSFSKIMTSDRLLYVFGSFSPRLALLLSMTLRYIPLFIRQSFAVEKAQQGLGLYKEDNFIDRIRGKLRVFSVMTTWALENGIITADSMTARGYGTGKRTFFSLFRFVKEDFLLLLLIFLLSGGTWVGHLSGHLSFVYYPIISYECNSALSILSVFCYGCLCFLPTVYQLLEALQWKSLRSKI